jgi:hypothetical protein
VCLQNYRERSECVYLAGKYFCCVVDEHGKGGSEVRVRSWFNIELCDGIWYSDIKPTVVLVFVFLNTSAATCDYNCQATGYFPLSGMCKISDVNLCNHFLLLGRIVILTIIVCSSS